MPCALRSSYKNEQREGRGCSLVGCVARKKNPELPAGRDSPGCPGAAEPTGLGFAAVTAVPAPCAENLGGAMQVFEQQTPPCTPALPLAGRRPGDGSQIEQGRFRGAAGGKGREGALYDHRAPSRCRRLPSDPLGCFLPVCHRFIIHLNEGLIGGCANYGDIISQ